MTRLRALAAVVVAAGASVALALPAYAGTPSFDFTTPARGQVLAGDSFTFDLTVRMPTSDGRLVGDITVDFTPVSGRTTPAQIKRTPGSVQSYRVTQPVSFPWNGTYEVKATAAGRNNFLDGNTTPATDTATFSVDANPLPPTGVIVKADSKTRFVTISWAENKEPDRAGYVVQKQGSGGRWSDVFATEKTSVTDESTAKAGGTYSYRVRAVRYAATPGELNQSEPSSTQSATVSPPPTPPTTTPTGDGGSDGETEREGSTGGDSGQFDNGSSTGSAGSSGGTSSGGSGSSNRSGPPDLASTGKVDLSDFKSLVAKSQNGSGDELASGEDEGTYEETLPFGARGRNGGDDEEGEDGDPAAMAGDGDDGPADLQSLGFLAGGLLATVLAMHVLWVRSEVNRVDRLEVVAPEGPAPVSADARFGLEGGRPRRSRPQPSVEAPDPAAVP